MCYCSKLRVRLSMHILLVMEMELAKRTFMILLLCRKYTPNSIKADNRGANFEETQWKILRFQMLTLMAISKDMLLLGPLWKVGSPGVGCGSSVVPSICKLVVSTCKIRLLNFCISDSGGINVHLIYLFQKQLPYSTVKLLHSLLSYLKIVQG